MTKRGGPGTVSAKVSFQSAPIPILLGVGVLALFAFTSLGFAAFGVADLRVARKSEGWSEARGTVIAATVHETRVPFSEGSVSVVYRYSVGPKTYDSSRVAFGRGSRASLELVSKYRIGSEVAVHYDSSRPEVAVLEPGGSLLRMGAAFYVSIVSLLVTVGGLCWIIPRISWTE
jgi:hypothetical protein